MACWQNVSSRRTSSFSTPTFALYHCRASSMRPTMAIGVSQMAAATFAASSNSASGPLSMMS
jgi:hypothetical protein